MRKRIDESSELAQAHANRAQERQDDPTGDVFGGESRPFAKVKAIAARTRLALLEIEDESNALTGEMLRKANDILRLGLVGCGSFVVIDRSAQGATTREFIERERLDSHAINKDVRYRIKLGQELSADALLACHIMLLDKKHRYLSCELLDIAKAAGIGASSVEIKGNEEGLQASIMEVVRQIRAQAP